MSVIKVNAQQNIITTGINITALNGSISYSIGQQDYITYSSITGIMNEGLQQPFESFCSFLSGNIVAPSGIRQFAKLVPNVIIHNNITNPQQYSGNYTLQLSNNSNVLLTAYKNDDINKANGVTALDIAFIQNHILQKTILNSPYKIIAADVNGDGKVSALDIAYVKRLILKLDTTFTNVLTGEKRLWAFADSSYVFPNPKLPFPYKDSISFTSLTSSKINQTFIGMKLGDVNWDWNPAKARPGVENTSNDVEFYYSTDNERQWSDEGNEVRIPIKVKNFKDLLGMQFTLGFDASKLTFKGIVNNTLNIETGNVEQGNISFLWVDPKNEIKTLEDGTVLFEMLFVVQQANHDIKVRQAHQDIQLGLNGEVTAVAAYDKDNGLHNIVLSRVENVQPLPVGKEYFTIAPNPTTDGVIHVQMNLKERKTVVLRLIDNTGKLMVIKQVEGMPGTNSITLKQDGKLPTGVYYLQALGLDGEGVKKVVVE